MNAREKAAEALTGWHEAADTAEDLLRMIESAGLVIVTRCDHCLHFDRGCTLVEAGMDGARERDGCTDGEPKR